VEKSHQFVCAFRGRRDSYQVPLALAEVDLLDQFITDAYAMPLVCSIARIFPHGFRKKLRSRFLEGIPRERVRCLWFTTLLEHTRHKLGFAPVLTYAKLDARFSKAARARAEKFRSNLFLYSPYAWEAFTADYEHPPYRILFQYHPHHDTERRILEEDAKHFPDFAESSSARSRRAVPESVVRCERDVWRHADLIICASNFTRRSLIAAGCDESRCHVIPYGIELPSGHGVQSPQQFRVLFVGSGGQRKGLHHLLLAWQRASLPISSKLVVVCRAIEPGIERIVATSRRVDVRRDVSATELQDLYGSSSLLVMPSLVEGFGQVYLEALAHSCPVLGTRNTCLPDLGGEADGIFVVSVGNLNELTARLEFLSSFLATNQALRAAARACASRFTWPDFRLKIRKALDTERP